jgi:hypothetical protein
MSGRTFLGVEVLTGLVCRWKCKVSGADADGPRRRRPEESGREDYKSGKHLPVVNFSFSIFLKKDGNKPPISLAIDCVGCGRFEALGWVPGLRKLAGMKGQSTQQVNSGLGGRL